MMEMCKIEQNFLHISAKIQNICPIICQTCVGKAMRFGKHVAFPTENLSFGLVSKITLFVLVDLM
jgi:hypothetical protein